MPKTFAEYAAKRTAEMSPEGQAAVRVFDAFFSVGAAISQARRAQQLRQVDLANLSGVSQADISRIERGLLSPTTSTLLRLVGAMGGQLSVVVPVPAQTAELDAATAGAVAVTTAGRSRQARQSSRQLQRA